MEPLHPPVIDCHMLFDPRPFQDRKSYQEAKSCLAVCENGWVVRIVDWARDDGRTSYRVLVVKVCDRDQPHYGLTWEVREDRLVPVPSIAGAQEAAAAWRAEQEARSLELATAAGQGVGRPLRV